MKRLNTFIIEKLKLGKDTKIGKVDPDDPDTWKVGDILAGTYSYSMTIPYFYQIIKRTSKSFTLGELDKKIVSGHYNGQFKEEPIPNKVVGKPKNVRINKFGSIVINRVHLYLWDGKPVWGCDLD